MTGTLYLVSTPIGNLEDITLRALRVLRDAHLIAAEDTRRTARLLHHYQIATPTTSIHAHNEAARASSLLDRLKRGEHIALVSDAGTPVLSDPGRHLIQAALADGIRVEAIPGASAILAALAMSGQGDEGFSFLGFPPFRSKARTQWFAAAGAEPRPVVFFEAPHRLLACLQDARESLGNRQIIVCRELTKVHEERLDKSLDEMIAHFGETEPKGEFTLILPPEPRDADETPAELPAEHLLWHEFCELTSSGMGRREALSVIARRYQQPTRTVYAAVERAKQLADQA